MNGHDLHPGASVFPSPLALSHTWNPQIVRDISVATAKEMRATGAHLALGLSLGVARDLRWKYIGETFGEDPWLVATLGAARVDGLQQRNKPSPFPASMAVATHFLGSSQTMGGRDGAENSLSERVLRQTFLDPYKQAIQSDVGAVVVHSHSVLSKPLGIQRYWLEQVLREELGHKGLILAGPRTLPALVEEHFVAKNLKEATKHALLAGSDMFFDAQDFVKPAVQAVKEGQVPSKVIDQACRRVLEAKIRMGLFSKKKKKEEKTKENLAQKAHINLAKEAAFQSIVLLKNQELLPLSAEKLERGGDRIVVTGLTPEHTTVFQGIKRYLQGKVRVDYMPMPEGNVESGSAPWSTLVIAVVGNDLLTQGQSNNQANLSLDPKQLAWLKYIKSRANTLAVIVEGNQPFAMPWLHQSADAVLFAFQPSMKAGDAIAGILFGERSPEGRLTLSLPRDPSQTLIHYDHPLGQPEEKKSEESSTDKTSPLYAFGEGLSYTKFCYEKIHLNRKKITAKDTLQLDVTIKNCGERNGVEVVQVYLRDIVAPTIRPHHKLIGFRKVKLSKDESKRVRFRIPSKDLEILDDEFKRSAEAGEFELLVGPSSSLDALSLRKKFELILK